MKPRKKCSGGAKCGANSGATKTQIELVVMVTDYQMFPGAPTIANVHPDEVDNWKALGWKTQE